MKKRKITEALNDFYTGKDLNVGHYLIRCARGTQLLSHVDENIGLQVYDTEKLLYQSLANHYRWGIMEYKYQLRDVQQEDKYTQKQTFKGKMFELKTYMKSADKSMKKELKEEMRKLKEMGYNGYHKQRQQNIVNKMVELGDMVVESEDTAKERNTEVMRFIESLPMHAIEHPYVDDWKEISTPNGWDVYFKIDKNKFSSRESYLKTVISKMRSLSVSKRPALEEMIYNYAEKRAIEESQKNKALKDRCEALKKDIWKWKDRAKFPEVMDEALRGLNEVMYNASIVEMLKFSRLTTKKNLNVLYSGTIKELTKELESLQENQM